jgi:hypothetical protein
MGEAVPLDQVLVDALGVAPKLDHPRERRQRVRPGAAVSKARPGNLRKAGMTAFVG